MSEALRLSADAEAQIAALAQTEKILLKAGTGGAVKSKNALWINADAKPIDAFVSAAREKQNFQIELFEAFRKTQTSQRINHWFKENTGGVFDKIFTAETFPANDGIIVTNACRCDLPWEKAFFPGDSAVHPFTGSDGKARHVTYLCAMKRDIWYAETASFQAVAIPYAGGKTEMVVILPAKTETLAGVSGKISAESFEKLRTAPMMYNGKSTASYSVDLALPKFVFRKEINLPEIMKSAGVKSLFQPEKADLSGIAQKPLWVSDARQQIEIEVNETGTRVSGATDMSMVFGEMPNTGKAVFAAERPFLFFVREKETGLILCIGRIDCTDGLEVTQPTPARR